MNIDAPSRSRIPALRALWQEAFGDGEAFLDDFFTAAFSPERSRCVTIARETAAALYWFDCSWRERPAAYLYAVATAGAYRGRGLCSALLEDTHRHLQKLGCEGVILVPGSAELFAFYEKFGYHVCSRVGELCCSASESAADLRQIEAGAYARLRRELLPEGGVVQEKENLWFLQTQASFYAGDGFVLAARREGETLYGAELLGDTAAAPAIVRALGCTDGRFRIPGDDRPFAMYRPLRETGTAEPSYFGLAFD